MTFHSKTIGSLPVHLLPRPDAGDLYVRPTMNLDALFDQVATFLASRGAHVNRYDGRKLTSAELDDFEYSVALRLPTDYREYLSELGDNFCFQYDWEEEFYNWRLSAIEEVQSVRKEFVMMLEALNAGRGADYGIPDSSTPDELSRVRKRFQSWLPIYDIGCGGYVLSLDTTETPSPIRYLDINYEINAPFESSMIVATSLADWIHQWSRYCFSNPAPGGKSFQFTSFARMRPGLFDWAPHNFLTSLDRGANEVEQD